MIIGIIGKAGVGKSTLIESLDSILQSCKTVIVDLYVHKLIKKDKFYQDLLLYLTGTLNRPEMRKVLFNDPSKMSLIESYVGNKLKKEVNDLENYFNYIIVESANLDKFPINPDIWIEVVCDDDIRVNRLIERDGESKAQDLIKFQRDLTYDIQDKIVFNNTNPTENEILELISKFRREDDEL